MNQALLSKSKMNPAMFLKQVYDIAWDTFYDSPKEITLWRIEGTLQIPGGNEVEEADTNAVCIGFKKDMRPILIAFWANDNYYLVYTPHEFGKPSHVTARQAGPKFFRDLAAYLKTISEFKFPKTP